MAGQPWQLAGAVVSDIASCSAESRQCQTHFRFGRNDWSEKFI